MSGKKRFFVGTITGDEAMLTGEEYAHARTVLRLNVGSEVILLSSDGMEHDGIVTSVGKKEIAVHILCRREGGREAKTDVRLLFGFLKNADKNEFVVQKATELGVSSIGVFTSEYSSAYINENKLERLRRVAQEAAKQCLRSRVPEIVFYPTLHEAFNAGMGYTNKLFACEFATESEVELSSLQGSSVLVVGSEGGFSRGEAEAARAAGYRSVTLGKRILRAETAAIALTSVVYSLGEWRQ